jgi:flagellar hook-associated protein FlgK
MPNFSIGISGLLTAQSCLDLIGTNVANASTEGYHRQEGVLKPEVTGTQGATQGGGVTMVGVRRVIDYLVEQQLLQQQSISSQASQNLSVLQSIESSFGQTGSQPLATDLGSFLSSFSELTTSPQNAAYQQQVVNSGAMLANDFRLVSEYVAQEQRDLTHQVDTLAGQVNVLSGRIAGLNIQIKNANNPNALNVLEDQRDQAISDLADLVGVQSPDYSNETTSRNVYTSEVALVTGTGTSTLVSGTCDDGDVGLSIKGQDYYRSDYTGGKLGAVLELVNRTLPNLREQLDTLAAQIAKSVNDLHVQGVGQGGSFGELTSGQRGTDEISGWSSDVVAGSFYVRVIDQSTGQAVRSEISVDPATGTLPSVATALSLVPHLSASVSGGQLTIQAASGYKFDFLPALSATPKTSSLTGTSNASISGVYTGTTDENYTVTVVGTGQVGVAGDLHLEVRDSAGTFIKRLNVGSGYAAGDKLDAGSGIGLSMSGGTLVDGDDFTVQALSSSDSSGFLAAAGINTFFEGSTAGTISVRQELLDNPAGLAISSSQSMDDADNLTRMAAIIDQSYEGLGNFTLEGYLTKTISDLGTLVATAQARQTATSQVVQQLTNQRDSVSGVDVNEESARLLEYQRMYQAMAKFISVQDQTIQYLISAMQ